MGKHSEAKIVVTVELQSITALSTQMEEKSSKAKFFRQKNTQSSR